MNYEIMYFKIQRFKNKIKYNTINKLELFGKLVNRSFVTIVKLKKENKSS